MDKINIKNLEIFAKHGVLPEEKMHGQIFVISASLFVDLRNAGITDDLAKTIDYGEICRVIKTFIKRNSFNLIETMAERLAERLLIDNPSLQSIWLEIRKPNAPIPMSLESVSVEIERGRHKAVIAIGSNLGDRETHMNFAVGELEKSNGCSVLRVSKFIRTAPYGYAEQGDFLNGCLLLDTILTPVELLTLLQNIENKAGRVRDMHWGPRTLDLDIIYYDDLIMSSDMLRIPHAEAHRRDFVLIPLDEIAPNLLHPITNKTASEMLGESSDDAIVTVIKEE